MSTSNPEDLKNLFAAVKNGNVTVARDLLSKGVDPNGRNAQDETPLMVTAPKGNLDIFDLLQKAGADLGARTKDGNLVLFRAAMCRHGNEAVALEMLQRIVNVVGIGPDRDRLNYVLVRCSADRSPDYLRALVRFGADPNFRTEEGESAMLRAVWENRPEAVSALLATGANPIATVPRGRSLSWLEHIPRRYWDKPLIDLAAGKRLGRITDLLLAAGATPTAPSAVLDIAVSWEKIEGWLQAHAPQWTPLKAGATEREIAATQSDLNLTFPAEFQSCYAKHNGSASLFPGVDVQHYLMPLSEIVQHWQMLGSRLDGNDFEGSDGKADIGIAPVPWCKAWVPFVSNGGGDYYCLDLAPSENGTVGQIISFNHETGDRWLIAPSLRTWLADLAQELQAGRLRYEAGKGLVDALDRGNV
jgi:cell wall assembly regulator SMI1